jgi:hypothetical protein
MAPAQLAADSYEAGQRQPGDYEAQARTAPVRCTGNRIRPKTVPSRPPCRGLTKFLFHFSMRQPLVQTFPNGDGPGIPEKDRKIRKKE